MHSENLPILSAENADVPRLLQDPGLMPDSVEQREGSGVGLHDILFMFFRHKWKILLFAVSGVLGAVGFYLLAPPLYESQAKLLVRYVVEHNAVDGLDQMVKTPGPENHALINSEVEILTSQDLIRQVAEAVRANKLGLGPADTATMGNAV